MSEAFTHDDPRLTAYVLGELEGADRAGLEATLTRREDLRETVREIERVVGLIQKSKAAQRDYVSTRPYRPLSGLKDSLQLPPTKPFHWALWGPLAALTVTALVFLLWRTMVWAPNALPEDKHASNMSLVQPRAAVDFPQKQVSPGPVAEVSGNPDGAAGERGSFRSPRETPLTVLALRAGTASYRIVRDTLKRGDLPRPNEVRIEEMVNNFSYNYPEPDQGKPFSLIAETGPAPWNPANRLLRVGVKTASEPEDAREHKQPNTDTAVKTARLHVAFNPVSVRFYRLLGFEGDSGDGDFESVDLAAGKAFTALYEWVPEHDGQGPNPDGEHLPLIESAPKLDGSVTISMHFRNHGEDQEQNLERPVYDSGLQKEFVRNPPDFKFTAAVAGFGLILRGDPRIGDFSLDACRKLAREGLDRDPDGKRHELIELIDMAEALIDQ